MTAVVVSLDALREQRRRTARVVAGEVVRPWQKPARIVARFASAATVVDLASVDKHPVVVVNLGKRTVRGRVFLARRDRFGQVRLVLEFRDGSGPRAEAIILRPEAQLLVLAPEVKPRSSGSAAPPCASSPRGPR